jgi:hypothetical protein
MNGINEPCFNLVADNDVLKQGTSISDNISVDTYKLIVSLQETIEDLITKQLEHDKILFELENSNKVLSNENNKINTKLEELQEENRVLKIKVYNIEKHLGADDSYCLGNDSFNEDKEPLKPLLTLLEQYVKKYELSDSVLDNNSMLNSIPDSNEKSIVVKGKMGAKTLEVLNWWKTLPLIGGTGKPPYLTSEMITDHLYIDMKDEYKYKTRDSARVTGRKIRLNLLDVFPNKVKLGPVRNKEKVLRLETK